VQNAVNGPAGRERHERQSTETAKSETAHAHPLDPLSVDEFCRVRAALAKAHGVGPGWRFASMELREPPKRAMLAKDVTA